ncbi:TonB-dependent receptor plug domain-containing protein [Verrucomicrobiota bacterium]
MQRFAGMPWVYGALALLATPAAAATNENARVRQLDEIVVVAARDETGLYDVPASVELIDAQEVARTGAMTVGALLRHAVGVEFQGGGVPGSPVRVNLRGLTPGYQAKRVLVLVDGMRVNDQYQGNVEFALLPADIIERIEILRGPGSALYGSNAMGGVINVVTRTWASARERGVGEDEALELSASAGTYNTLRYGVNHGRLFGDGDYFVSASHVQTDGYLDTADGRNRDWTADNVTGNFGWRVVDDSELRLYLGVYGGEGTDANSDRRTTRDFQNLQYTTHRGEERDARLLVRAYRIGARHVYDWTYPGRGVYRQDTLAAEAQHSSWIGRRQRVNVGAEARRERVDIDEVLGPTEESGSLGAVYLQDELHLAELLQVSLGLRCDRETDYGTELSPRAGALVRTSSRSELFASVNRAHRAPALSDRFVRTEFGGFMFEGNPDLDPETVTAYEAGYRNRHLAGCTVELTCFRNDMEDAFDFMLDPDGVFRNRNVTSARASGAETRVEYAFTESLSGHITYTYTRGRYEAFPPSPDVEGNRLAYLAESKAGAGVRLDLGRASQSLSLRYVGGRYGDAQNTAANKMAAYAVLDWHVRFSLTDRARLTLDVDNVLDEDYEDFPGVAQPGRFVMAGMEVSL